MVKKIRKKRKPMTEDQRQAAAERLKKARASRAEKNPNYGKSGIHSSLHNLDEDDDFHPDKIKEWIKIQKDIVSSEKKNERNNVKGAIARRISHENYIKIMQIYLRDGVWIGLFIRVWLKEMLECGILILTVLIQKKCLSLIGVGK